MKIEIKAKPEEIYENRNKSNSRFIYESSQRLPSSYNNKS